MIRRSLLLAAASSAWPSLARAFGQQGAFHARSIVRAEGRKPSGVRETALSRWAWELVRRTSAPARLLPQPVVLDSPELLNEPFLVWYGDKPVKPLTSGERNRLRRFIELGGVLVVDDSAPGSLEFSASVKRELARVLPESPVVRLSAKHVVYKSYYLIERPVGRHLGPPHLEAIVRGRHLQVLISSHDLLGALAFERGGTWSLPMEASLTEARQMAVRLAVNIAMFVLCSDYKDDQVHAEELMRRRGRHKTAR